METSHILREQLRDLMSGGNAHMSFDAAVAGFPVREINRRVPNGSYTVWHLLEHIRIAQWDILEFVVNPAHVSPDFPEGYWPDPDETATQSQWEKTLSRFRADLARALSLITHQKTELLAPLPHAPGFTVLREVLLIADHNAYHLGEFVALRRVLNLKPIREY